MQQGDGRHHQHILLVLPSPLQLQRDVQLPDVTARGFGVLCTRDNLRLLCAVVALRVVHNERYWKQVGAVFRSVPLHVLPSFKPVSQGLVPDNCRHFMRSWRRAIMDISRSKKTFVYHSFHKYKKTSHFSSLRIQ